jgi:hypothetical protein
LTAEEKLKKLPGAFYNVLGHGELVETTGWIRGPAKKDRFLFHGIQTSTSTSGNPTRAA